MLVRILIMFVSLSLCSCATQVSMKDVIGTTEDVEAEESSSIQQKDTQFKFVELAYQGVPLNVLIVKRRSPSVRVFHYGGNGYSAIGKASKYLQLLDTLDATGIFFDYPRTNGDDEAGYSLAFYEGIHEFIREKIDTIGIDTSFSVHIGHSIGTHFAAKAASERNELMILQGPVSTMQDMIELHTPSLIRWAVDVTPDKETAAIGVCYGATNFEGHVLLLAAEKDKVTPVEMVRSVKQCLSNTKSKELIIVKNAKHNQHFDSFETITTVGKWMQQHVALSTIKNVD